MFPACGGPSSEPAVYGPRPVPQGSWFGLTRRGSVQVQRERSGGFEILSDRHARWLRIEGEHSEIAFDYLERAAALVAVPTVTVIVAAPAGTRRRQNGIDLSGLTKCRKVLYVVGPLFDLTVT